MIKKYEDQRLYGYQTKLIEDADRGFEESILRLALLQTLPPISDYSEAINILHRYFTHDRSFLYNAIGAHLTSGWDFETDNNAFLDALKADKVSTIEKEAIILFLDGLDAMRKYSLSRDPIYKNIAKDRYTVALKKDPELNNCRRCLAQLEPDYIDEEILFERSDYSIYELTSPINYFTEFIL